MKLPRTGDLIYIKRTISGVITSGDPFTDTTWEYALTSIEPNQTAIVLKSFNPSDTHRTTNLLEDPNPGDHKNYVVVVLSLGNFVVETIYSPDYMDVISSVN